MKTQFRNELFQRIRSELLGISGKQIEIAKSLGIFQADVSIIKLGRMDSFSTDKLIDIAKKCGVSFTFELVQCDRAVIVDAKARGVKDLRDHLSATFARLDGDD